MSEDGFPYCVPDKRDLTRAEFALLDFLIGQAKEISVSVKDLKVVARCGCGKCPTVLFGRSFDDEPITAKDADDRLDWSGRAENGTLVGIGMWAKDGMPTELEAWSVDGGDIENWPPLDAIQRDV